MQPVLTLFTKPNNQTVLSVVFVDLAEIVTLRAILYAAVAAETVNLAVSCFVDVSWINHGKRTTH